MAPSSSVPAQFGLSAEPAVSHSLTIMADLNCAYIIWVQRTGGVETAYTMEISGNPVEWAVRRCESTANVGLRDGTSNYHIFELGQFSQENWQRLRELAKTIGGHQPPTQWILNLFSEMVKHDCTQGAELREVIEQLAKTFQP